MFGSCKDYSVLLFYFRIAAFLALIFIWASLGNHNGGVKMGKLRDSTDSKGPPAFNSIRPKGSPHIQACAGCVEKNSGVVVATLKMLLPTYTHVYSCSNIPAKRSLYSQEYRQQRQTFRTYLNNLNMKITEGHSANRKTEGQYKFYHRIAQEPWVNVICETGFNAGHSAFQWLASSANTTKLFSFDICRHPYTSPMAEYITATFPGRFSLTCGDSTKTLPLMTNLINKCDLVIVDGGHTYRVATADLLNFKVLANPDHHVVIIDDVPGMSAVVKSWKNAKLKKLVTELFMCQAGKKRGLAVGVYTTNNI